MVTNNGSSDFGGPPFAVIATKFAIMPRAGVIEMLEKNAVAQGKMDLKAGPVFREIADVFREWSKDAEPGMLLRAEKVQIVIIRLSAHSPATMWTQQTESETPRIATG